MVAFCCADENTRVPNDGKVDNETPDTLPKDGAPNHGNSADAAKKDEKNAKDGSTEPEMDDAMGDDKSVLQGKLTKLAIQIGYAGKTGFYCKRGAVWHSRFSPDVYI